MTLNRKDFTYSATSSGYMIQYKGQNIGGAGTLQPYKGRKRAQQAAEYQASAELCITYLVEGHGQQRFLDAIERIDNPVPPSTKPARYISFASGIVSAAHNEAEWADPIVQLRDRVLNTGDAAKLLDADYKVIAEMTYAQALAMGPGTKLAPADAAPVLPRVGFLKLDRQERFNMKRAWFVNAYRIVDAEGNDMVQPWSNTKTEARATAKALGITLDESRIK